MQRKRVWALEEGERQRLSPPVPSPNPATNSGWERGSGGQREEGMGSQTKFGN